VRTYATLTADSSTYKLLRDDHRVQEEAAIFSCAARGRNLAARLRIYPHGMGRANAGRRKLVAASVVVR